MLVGLDPILGPELLFALRSMGHGDEIAIVDGNYPAQTDARRLIRADGHGIVRVLEAVLSVMPLDRDVEFPATRTQNVNHPDTPDPIHVDIERVLTRSVDPNQIDATHGPVFYTRVKNCHTVVSTSESALFANIILRKGVVSDTIN